MVGTGLYIVLLAFLVYQDWALGHVLNSRAWHWEIAGITVAFGALILRMVLVYAFQVPRLWLTLIALVMGIIPLACLIWSRHLLHKSIVRMFARDETPPQ